MIMAFLFKHVVRTTVDQLLRCTLEDTCHD